MNFNLKFEPQSVDPRIEGDYLLYNQCDGYHKAEARLFDDGSFCGFYDFMGNEFPPDTYQAWARLPNSDCLYEQFADKPADGKSAYEMTLERLSKQPA